MLWAFCHIYQVVFNIFNFCEKALISNCSNLWQFFVEIFTMLMFILFVYFLKRKEVPPGFNPWLYLLFNPLSPQGIYLHHSNPSVLKISCAKFHASSCFQTKVIGAVLPPYLFLPPPHPTHTHPKRRFKKLTRNRVTNMIIDKAKLEGLKVFCVQTLLRQYAPCERNSIDEVWYSSQGLIKTL